LIPAACCRARLRQSGSLAEVVATSLRSIGTSTGAIYRGAIADLTLRQISTTALVV